MIEQAIKALVGLGKQTAAYQKVDRDRRTSLVYRPDYPEFELEIQRCPEPPRNSQFTEIQSFDDALERFDPDSEASIWVACDGVVCVLNEQWRDDVLVLPLTPSDQWLALEDIPPDMSQKQVIRWLRRHMTGADLLLSKLRRIDFKRSSDGTASIEHGKESLGKKVEAAVQSVEDIPDEFTLEVPRWNVAGLRDTYEVKLLLDIDLQSETFQLMCAPNELEMAQDQAMRALNSQLTGRVGVRPVFNGTP